MKISGKIIEIHPVSWKLEKQNEIDKNREKYFEKHLRPFQYKISG